MKRKKIDEPRGKGKERRLKWVVKKGGGKKKMKEMEGKARKKWEMWQTLHGQKTLKKEEGCLKIF